MDERENAARKFLIGAQNADGGWSYVPGGTSSPESTCYALMAGAPTEGACWLMAHVHGDAIALDGDNEPHWTTSLAVIALGGNNGLQRRLVKWLLTCEGRKVAMGAEVAMDGNLRGWPWATGCFSWVEPTSYALLALKLHGQKNHPRVAEGERLLLDRVCADGGWNYGNPKVMGAALPSFVPTTALAVLALQDVAPARDVVTRALQFMNIEVRKRPSDLSLALAILCFNAFGMAKAELVEALARRQRTDGSWQGQVHLTALAVLALEASGEARNVFRLPK